MRYGQHFRRIKAASKELRQPKWILIGVISIIVILGILLSLISTVSTIRSERLYGMSICFTSGCIEFFKKEMDGPISILKATGGITAWLAAVGGIIIALMSYLATSRVTAFGNHVSHISIFTKYMEYEISRRNRIRVESVDVYKLYSLMFSSSVKGAMTVSKEYVSAVSKVAGVISNSNKIYSVASQKQFRFRAHQLEFRKSVSGIGISIDLLNRLDFLEVEGEVVSLIDSVNIVFANDAITDLLPARKYI